MTTTSTFLRVGVNFASAEEQDWVSAYFTIDPNNLIVARWPAIRPEVVAIIEELPWAVLSVVRGAYHSPPKVDLETNTIILDGFYPPKPKPESHPIILVGAPAESQASWQVMAERIYSLCRNASLEHARVLFESIRYPLTATEPFESSSARPLKAAELANVVPMGSSFGPVEEQTSATIGGTIKLQRNGTSNSEEPSALLLSVFHPFASLVKEQEKTQGYRYDSIRPINLGMPSPQDICNKRDFYQGQIDEVKEMIERNNDNFGLLGDEKFRKNADKLEKSLEKYQVYLQELFDHTCRDLGILQYGSGFERATDWSLSLFKNRIMENTPPTTEEVADAMGKASVDPEDSELALRQYHFATGYSSTVGARDSPEIDSLVVKQGRSTGLTVGRVNALPSDLLVSDSLKLKKAVSFEVRAVLIGGNFPIVDLGDSGAWFLNMDGNWIGSIVGMHNPKGCSSRVDIALVVEAEKIIKDIEEFTGKKVVSPRQVGQVQDFIRDMR